MIADTTAVETCEVCGATFSPGGAFCRLYEAAESVALCCPACAEAYLLSSHVSDVGRLADDIVEQCVAEWRWRELGR